MSALGTLVFQTYPPQEVVRNNIGVKISKRCDIFIVVALWLWVLGDWPKD